jgi:hypothetical protein
VYQRAADFLLRLLIQPTSPAKAKFERADGAIDAYRALGLVDTEEAQWWRKRFEQEARDVDIDLFRPDPDVAERALQLIDERIDRLESLGRGGPADPDEVLHAMRKLGDFEQIGLLTREGARPRFDRLERLLGTFEPPDEQQLPDCCHGRLRRFVPGPAERHAGIRVIGFDLYEDGVTVRWHLVRLAPDVNGALRRLPDERESDEAARQARSPFFRLRDDIGTTYEFQGGGGGGYGEQFVDRVRKGMQTFRGAVPSEARTLCAINGECRFEVAL